MSDPTGRAFRSKFSCEWSVVTNKFDCNYPSIWDWTCSYVFPVSKNGLSPIFLKPFSGTFGSILRSHFVGRSNTRKCSVSACSLWYRNWISESDQTWGSLVCFFSVCDGRNLSQRTRNAYSLCLQTRDLHSVKGESHVIRCSCRLCWFLMGYRKAILHRCGHTFHHQTTLHHMLLSEYSLVSTKFPHATLTHHRNSNASDTKKDIARAAADEKPPTEPARVPAVPVRREVLMRSHYSQIALHTETLSVLNTSPVQTLIASVFHTGLSHGWSHWFTCHLLSLSLLFFDSRTAIFWVLLIKLCSLPEEFRLLASVANCVKRYQLVVQMANEAECSLAAETVSFENCNSRLLNLSN